MNAGNRTHKWLPFWGLQLLLLSLLTLCAQLAHSAEIRSQVDRARISVDETLLLRVRVSPQSDSNPDFSQLEKQFDILGRAQNSQYRNINGQIEAYTEWQLTLAPKATGKLLIPSFQYQDAYSDAILLEVTDAATTDNGALPDMYLEVSVDNPNPYVQEQVIVSVKLNTAVPLRIQDAPALSIADSPIVNIGDVQYQKRKGEKVFTIKELRYALFPQKSGTLEIPSQIFTVTTDGNRSWSNPFQIATGGTRRLRSQAITLAVKPQAATYTGKHWLPASNLELSQEWINDADNWQVGEPITRKITMTAAALTENQLPSLQLDPPQGLKFYRETPERADQTSTDGVATQVTETIAIVPTEPGQYTLPEVTLTWWNTRKQRQETARLPARTITVVANPSLANLAPPSQPAAAPSAATTQSLSAPSAGLGGLWFWVSALLLATNLATLVFWRRAQQAGSPPQKRHVCTPSTTDWQYLARLCEGAMTQERAIAILRWLDTWAKPLGPEPLPKRLRQAKLDTLASQVNGLEMFAYGNNATFNGNLNNIVAIVKATGRPTVEPSEAQDFALKPLYPTG